MYNGIFAIHGDPDETYSVTGVDAAKSLSEYGIRIAQPNGAPAVAVLISVETNAARIKWGGRDSNGHKIAADGSYMGYGTEVVKKLKVGNAAASSNATLRITCFF
jgi:hypothetical protein